MSESAKKEIVTNTLLNHRSVIILMLILSASFALRLWGIWFGLPDIFHPDEGFEVTRALKLGMGYFDFERIAKGGLYLILFLEYEIYFLFLKVFDTVQTRADFLYTFFYNPSFFYIIGRFTSAAIGTINIYILYLLGKKIYQKEVGLLASLFLGIDFLHVTNSHFITVDILMTCLVTISLLLSVYIYETGKLKYYIFCGVVIALATQTKIVALICFIPLLSAHIMYIRKSGKGLKSYIFDNKLIMCVIIFIIATLILNPGLIINFKKILNLILTSYLGKTNFDSAGIALSKEPVKESVNLFFFYSKAIKYSMGLPLLIITILGIAFSLYTRKNEEIILVLFCVSFYFLMSISDHPYLRYSRYMLPVMPTLYLFAANIVNEIFARLYKKLMVIVAVILLFLFLIEPLGKVVLFDLRNSFKDTRTIAKEWVNDNIPKGSKILIKGGVSKSSTFTVPLRDKEENIKKIASEIYKENPAQAKLLNIAAKALAGNEYDLVLFRQHRDLYDVNYYKDHGIDYIIISPEKAKGKHSGFKYFYNELNDDSRIKKIFQIKGNRYNRPGPRIEIYEINLK